MTSDTPPQPKALFKKYDIPIFYIIAFLITWGGWSIMDVTFTTFGTERNFVELITDGYYYMIFYPFIAIGAVWGPLLSAFIVYRVNYGKAGTKELLKKIFNWRVAIPWYIIAFGVPTLIKYGTFYLNVWFLGGTFVSDFERVSVLVILITYFGELVPSGGQEEVGWTGFAQLRLQQQLPVIPATLIKALMGWIWHLPLYLAFAWSGVFGSDIWFFLAFYIALAFIYTWIFNNTDSVLIPALFHATFNTIGTFAITNYTSWGNVSISLIIFCAIAYIFVFIAFIRDGKNLTRKELPVIVPAQFQELRDSEKMTATSFEENNSGEKFESEEEE
ncbi:MAG: CPBP family intramembrane glutamic endopeptidase [Candidatus Thorarchaeota archaeon]